MASKTALIGRTVETKDSSGNIYTSTIRKVINRNGKLRLHCTHPHGYGFTLAITPEEIDERVK